MRSLNSGLLSSFALIGLTGLIEGDCPPCDGGISCSFGWECSNILDLVFNEGKLVGIVTDGTPAQEYVYDDDNTAFYNQTGSLADNKFEVTQSAFMKFCGINCMKTDAANKAKKCCCVVFIHFGNDCGVHIQGIEFDESCNSDGSWRFSKKRARIVPSINTNTSDGSSGVEYAIESISRCFVPVDEAVITKDYVRAL